MDPQQRALEFQVGQSVVHWGRPQEESGRVTAVWPAIGQVDVEFPGGIGSMRIPVEDVQKVDDDSWIVTPETVSIPGGRTVAVPGGPPKKQASVDRVIEGYIKKALYWHQRDRKYRVSQPESSSGQYLCPRCADEVALKDAVYKRQEGQSVKLLGCPSCLFLVKTTDLVGHVDFVSAPVPAMPKGRNALIQLLQGDE